MAQTSTIPKLQGNDCATYNKVTEVWPLREGRILACSSSSASCPKDAKSGRSTITQTPLVHLALSLLLFSLFTPPGSWIEDAAFNAVSYNKSLQLHVRAAVINKRIAEIQIDEDTRQPTLHDNPPGDTKFRVSNGS